MEPESSATNHFSLDGDRSNIVRADEKLTAFRDSKRRFEDAPVRPSETLSIAAIGVKAWLLILAAAAVV
jgi:hypothetical protein